MSPTSKTKMLSTEPCEACGLMPMNMMRSVTLMICIPASHRSPSGEPFRWATQYINWPNYEFLSSTMTTSTSTWTVETSGTGDIDELKVRVNNSLQKLSGKTRIADLDIKSSARKDIVALQDYMHYIDINGKKIPIKENAQE